MASTLHWLFGLFKSLPKASEADQSLAPSRMILEELESRTLFSADPVSGLLNIPELLEPQSFESIPVETVLIDNEPKNSSITVDTEIRNELIFIDETVTDSDQLINDLLSKESDNRNFTVVVLDSEKNGIDQITEVLQNHQGLDAVHIISHGTQGSVTLGNTQLNSSNLDDYSTTISLWQNSFDEDADFLIYGCEIAGNIAGESLTEQLSILTGTDVAASVDDTGNSARGGDWKLEFTTGNIETEIAFSKKTQHSWDGLLAYNTYRDEFNAPSLINSDGSQDWSSGAWQEISDDGSANSGNVMVTTVLEEQGLHIRQDSSGVLREVDLSGATNASLSFDYARIGLDDAPDSIVLEVSGDGGGSWSLLDTWTGPANDSSMLYASYDISDHIANDTQIRFVVTRLNGSNDGFFVDNIQIAYNENLNEKPEFLVNSSNTNSQETSGQTRGSHQSVAVASNSDYVVVWTEVENTGDLSDVYAQQFNADGSEKNPAFKVNSTSTNEQQWASVASDASGRFVVTWVSQNQDGDGQGIYLKRFDASGNEIDTNDILVNSGRTSGNQTAPSVAVNSQGEMVITWQSDDATNAGIFAKTFDMSSAAFGDTVPSGLIIVSFGSGMTNPSVDINSEGKFVIAWQNNNEPYVQRFNATGTQRGSKIDINPLSPFIEKYPVVAIQESGDFLVAYRSDITLLEGVWVRHYNDDGSSVNGLFATKVSSDISHTAPSIAKDLEGNFIIVYEGAGDGDGQGIFARKYDSSHNVLGPAFQINETTSGDQQMASIAMLDLDTYVVVWSGNGADDANGVYARQFANNTPTTSGLSDVTVVEDSADSDIDLLAAFSDVEDLDSDLIYSIQSNTNTGLFTASTLDSATNTLTLDYALNQIGSSDITIRATDSGGKFIEATFTVTVNAVNDTPTSTGLADVTVDEDVADSVINLFAAFTDIEDLDRDLVYSIENNTNTSLFTTSTLDAAANTLTLNYAPNKNGSSDITIRATDSGGEFVETTFTVTVNAVNDSPTSSGLANITVSKDAPDSVIDLLTAFTDEEDLDTDLIYTIQSNTNTSLFTTSTVDAAANTLTLNYAPNQIGSSEITLRATDSNGAFVETLFTVTVNAINNPPTSSGLADITVDEDAANSVINLFAGFTDIEDADTVLTYSLSNNSNTGLFTATTIDGVAGTLTLEYAPNQNGSSDITVRATDSNGLFVETLFTVTVNSINDLPTFNHFTDIVETTNENDEIEITFSELIAQGDEFDIEGGIDGFIVKTLTSGNLRIGANAGSATLWNATTNNLINAGHHAYWTPDRDTNGIQNAFELVVKDNLNAESITNIMAQIEVIAINRAPISNNQPFSIAENSPNGTVVGTVTASDTDLADSLSFSIITGNSNNAFSINRSTGEITVNDSVQLDFENISNYIVTVQVTDNGVGNLTDTASIGIQLTDTNESPDSITLSNTHLDETIETSSGHTVGLLNATDEDTADTFTYTINGGVDQLNFSVGGTNQDELIISDGILVFENQSTYEITVRVTDAGGLSHDETFMVTINQLNTPDSSITEQNELITDPDNESDELVLIESTDEATISPPLEVKTDPDQGLFADIISTEINQQESSKIGGGDDVEVEVEVEVEADTNITNLLISQYTSPQDWIENTEKEPENEYRSTLEYQDNQQPNHNKMPIKMQVKTNTPGSNSLLNSKFTTVTVDENTLNFLLEQNDFSDSLDSLRKQVQENINFNKMVVGSSLSVTTGLSIGYVIWLIRGGVLLSTVLSSLPAWRMIDPLPIVARLNNTTDSEEDDSLESIVKKRLNRKNPI